MHWSKSVFTLRRLVFLAVLLALSVFTTSNRSAQAAASFPPGFVSEVVIGDGLFLPTAIAFAPDNRIFIAEKRGVVRVWQNGALLATPFIDLQDEVSDHGDRGLLGLAVHPSFPATPYVYLLYTYDPPGVIRDANGSRVSRLLRVTASAANPNVAATTPGSRVVLLGANGTLANSGNPNTLDDQENAACGRGPDYIRDCLPADFDTHDIGTVMFGKDGMLYVGNGDAASFLYADKRSLRALDLDSMAGKIFRIDPLTGAGLSDNPFYNGDPDANRSKVLSLGLRNPFRFTLHPVTNDPYIGDVGMDTWEEINAGRGKNFGWPCYEGGAQQGLYANSPLTAERCRQLYAEGVDAVKAPAYAYAHAGAGAATSGGAFYVGTNYPAQYRGALFIADYNRDWIKYLTFDAQGRATVHDFAEDVGGAGGPAQLIVGPDGNLYYVVLGAVNEVRRIRYVNVPNQPPVAHLNAAPNSGGTPLTVRFSSVDSFDPEAQTLSYTWEFGDGAISSQPNPSYTYFTPGAYMARLTVMDTQGLTASEQIEIIAGNSRPVVAINAPGSGTRYVIGSRISFSGTATDAEDGNLSPILQWKALLHHNEHTHFDFFSFTGASGTFVVPDHGDNTYYELCATVGDSAGATAVTRCVKLRPDTVQYTFNSVPSGLQLNYAGATYTTPFTVTTIPNSVRQISAAATQNGLNFVGWSDGGARAHNITIGAGNTTLTAAYQTGSGGGGGTIGDAQNVVWTNLINTTATGNSLRKTGGSSDGRFDGSGLAQQTLAGNGYLEFTAAGPNIERVCGLTGKATFDRPESLDFAVVFSETGYVEFRENGAYIGDTPFVNGDIFRIQIAGGRAQYFKNGALLATGNNTPAAQLRAVASFSLLNGEIANAKLSGGSGNNGGCTYSIAPQSQAFTAAGGTGTLNVTVAAGCAWVATTNAAWLSITAGTSGSGNGTVNYRVAANTGEQRAGTLTVAGRTFTVIQAPYVGGGGGGGDANVVWINPINTTVTDNLLQKTRGADDGSWDGSAVSQQTLAGSGFLEFSASGPDVYRACGLTDEAAPSNPDALDFAVVFTNSNIAEFREKGVYVGDVRFAKDDVFRIVINNGQASYYKNGELLFAGRQNAATTLRAAAVFSNLNGEISNAKLAATVNAALSESRREWKE